jgi:hypothetical protein
VLLCGLCGLLIPWCVAVCLVVSWITLINVEQNLFITENSFLTKKSNNPKSLEDMIKEDMIWKMEGCHPLGKGGDPMLVFTITLISASKGSKSSLLVTSYKKQKVSGLKLLY